jgi:hypothetical protein
VAPFALRSGFSRRLRLTISNPCLRLYVWVVLYPADGYAVFTSAIYIVR